MNAAPPTVTYTRTAIALHWLMAALILLLFGVGLYMQGLHLSPLKLRLYNWHKWAGVTTFLLLLLRLLWRLTHRPPELPASLPRWQRIAAHADHGVLYLLMVAVPLSGWLMSSAEGFQTVYFGVLPIPDLLARNKELGDLLDDIHAWLNYLMMALLAVHVAAAAKHHLVDRDDVLTRMAPWLGSKEQRT
jgi:cytochrome b561